MHTYSYLALGDSYTIGESLTLQQNFPFQTVTWLRKKGFSFYAPEIIARTGWTTDELEAAMKNHTFLPKYDIVTLLIGVNNQYRGREIIEYKDQFEELLKKAIALANGKKEHVFVISIPDYGVTPFATSKDPEKISHEIDLFNTVNKAISIQYKVQYVDITPSSRLAASDPGLIADDGLHPSEKEYANWAELLVEQIIKLLK
ncbi:MAG: SGNH/GDSL hydrolase family protein [Flavisolibacter sp.]